MSFVSDVLAVSGSAVAASIAGAVISIASQSAATRRAERNADRDQARALFTQIVTGIATMCVERAGFRERRDSVRANALVLGQLALEALTASRGSWLQAMPPSVRWIRQWDADEGARFVDRFQAAAAQVNPALVTLSLLSPDLQGPCSRVTDALAGTITARRRRDIERADADLSRACAELRAAVTAFTAQPRRMIRIGSADDSTPPGSATNPPELKATAG